MVRRPHCNSLAICARTLLSCALTRLQISFSWGLPSSISRGSRSFSISRIRGDDTGQRAAGFWNWKCSRNDKYFSSLLVTFIYPSLTRKIHILHGHSFRYRINSACNKIDTNRMETPTYRSLSLLQRLIIISSGATIARCSVELIVSYGSPHGL